MSISLYTFVQK